MGTYSAYSSDFTPSYNLKLNFIGNSFSSAHILEKVYGVLF